MNNFKLISLVFLIATAGMALGQSSPNVLFLMTDEHSPNALHCYGNDLIQTPNLDALAASGLLFANAYCQNPVCVPSRASLITGIMPSQVGIRGNSDSLSYDATMARLFREAGYDVEWLGKEHWGNNNQALGFGSENATLEKEMKTDYRTAKDFNNRIGRLPHDAEAYEFSGDIDFEGLLAQGAVDYLRERDPAKNFFLGVSFKKPHFPFMCNEEYYHLYKDEIDLPAVGPEMKNSWSITEKSESDKWKFEEMTPEQIKKARAMYYGMVTYVDEQIGKIITELKNQGLDENTIIIYTADHGEMNGEHGLWYKNSFYDASVSVPCIWSYPKQIKAGRKNDSPVMILDILPTLCELCSIEKPSGLSGSSYTPILVYGDKGKGRAAYSESYRSNSYGYMIRKGKWKYCWFAMEDGRLYNMKKDPEEVRNLIHDPANKDLVETLKKELESFLKKPLIRIDI